MNNWTQGLLIPVICLSLFAVNPSFGSSPDAWEEFRKDVEEKCLDAAEKRKLSATTYRAVVDPHGSQSYGFAFVEETNARYGVSWSLCIYDKGAQTAELTSLLMTELIKEFEKAGSIASTSDTGLNNSNQMSDGPTKVIHSAFSSGSILKGEASRQKDNWPFVLTIKLFDPSDGKWAGEIKWTTLDAVHEVEGTISGTIVKFKETDFIKKGSAIIGCIYKLDMADNEMRLTGTWSGASGCNQSGNVWINLR